MANPTLNTNGYGGVLPVNEWATCDAAVKAAWDNVAKLDKIASDAESGWYDPGDNAKNIRNAVETYKKAVAHWAQRLEELKHGPVTVVDAVRLWKDFAADGDKDVQRFAALGKLTSLSNALKTVSTDTAKDVAQGVKTSLTIGVPVVILALVAFILFKVKR